MKEYFKGISIIILLLFILSILKYNEYVENFLSISKYDIENDDKLNNYANKEKLFNKYIKTFENKNILKNNLSERLYKIFGFNLTPALYGIVFSKYIINQDNVITNENNLSNQFKYNLYNNDLTNYNTIYYNTSTIYNSSIEEQLIEQQPIEQQSTEEQPTEEQTIEKQENSFNYEFENNEKLCIDILFNFNVNISGFIIYPIYNQTNKEESNYFPNKLDFEGYNNNTNSWDKLCSINNNLKINYENFKNIALEDDFNKLLNNQNSDNPNCIYYMNIDYSSKYGEEEVENKYYKYRFKIHRTINNRYDKINIGHMVLYTKSDENLNN